MTGEPERSGVPAREVPAREVPAREAPGRGVPSPPGPGRPSLLTPAFRQILAITFLAFGMEAGVRALIPLLVLDRGGDAVMVGIAATAYSLPALLFRPFIGSVVDSWRHRLMYRAGALASAIIPVLVLLPGIPTIIVVRFLTGTSWGFFTVSNHSLLAKMAPANRRAEASGIFQSMPAMGQLVLPGLAVALYTSTGHETVPVLVAALMGLGAFALVMRMHVPQPTRPAAGDERVSLVQRIFEPSAIPPTVILITSFSAYSIFTVFAPVYVVTHLGAPVELLAVYYPIFGLAQAISQPIFGRFADRLGRAASITLGASLAAVALLVAAIRVEGLPEMVTFTLAAVIYALAQSFVNPTISAAVMERAPKHRVGSAMATWSIGFQFATGTSSLLWGAIIATWGFTWLFVAGVGFQVLAILLGRLVLGSPRSRPAI